MEVRVGRGDHAVDGRGIADVYVAAIGGDGNAIWLTQSVVDYPDLACGRTESVALGAELGSGVG